MNMFKLGSGLAKRYSCFAQITFTLLASAALLPSLKAANLGIANDFNAFIFKDVYSEGGSSDGGMAVGGDWRGTYYNVNSNGSTQSYNTIPGAPKAALYLGGSAKTSHYLRVDKGNGYYGGHNNGKLQASHGSIQQGINNNIFIETRNQLSTLSDQLASYNSVTIPTNQSNMTLNLASNTLNGNLKVYNVQASELSKMKTLNFSHVGAHDTVVINVLGTSASSGWQVNTGSLTNNKLLWNFADATTINIKHRDFNGSILAPNATVNQYEDINGTLVSKNLNVFCAAELNQYTFKGDLPPVVPEPSSMIMVMLGALFFTRRQKSKRTLV